MLGAVLVGWLAILALWSRWRPLTFRWEHPVGGCGVLLLGVGSVLGLFGPLHPLWEGLARIHVLGRPERLVTALTVGFATVCALLSLLTRRRRWESATEAAGEVALVQATALMIVRLAFSMAVADGCAILAQGMEVFTTILLASLLAGATLLRIGVRDPARRATASAVATILAGVTAWAFLFERWNFHAAVDLRRELPWEMIGVASLDTWGLLYLAVWFVAGRWRIAEARADRRPLEGALARSTRRRNLAR